METTDKIALGVLCLILVATAIASKPSDRYFFMGALIVYLIFYLMNKRRDARKRRGEKLEYGWREKSTEESYWGDIGDKGSPGSPES